MSAAYHKSGACLVLAGPGSGKTTVITERIRYLIEDCAVDAKQLLVITFTAKAAQEMKDRANLKCPKSQNAFFGTFHACFFQILKGNPSYREMSLASDHEKRNVLQQILYSNQISDGDTCYKLSDQLLKEISKCKNLGISSKEFQTNFVSNEQFQFLYQQYNKELHMQGKIDFDDMLLLCYDYLKKNPDVRKKLQEQYTYILIDEFQDVNAVQYAIVKMITNENQNIFVVGDDDQGIYRFRGANIACMQQFLKDFEGCKQICLDTNYRCDSEIVAYAQKCINHNKNRFEKECIAARNIGMSVNIVAFDNQLAEANYIIKKVVQFQRNKESSAVLFRTNKESRFLVEKLLQNNIKISVKEKLISFYDEECIRDVLAVFRFVTLGQKRYDFLQFMNKPSHFIHRSALKSEQVSLQMLLSYYAENKQMIKNIRELFRDLEELKQFPPIAALIFYRKKIGYDRYLAEKFKKEDALLEAKELLKELEERMKPFRTLESFLSYVTKQEELCKEVLKTEETTAEEVQIMTYHASKGLEFEHVILPSLQAGKVPSNRAVTAEDLEEERRMFYVAMTRAKNTLDMTYYEKDMSRFVKELLE